MSKENDSNCPPKRPKRPKFIPSVKRQVIQSAKNDKGEVICSHCEEEITNKQQITIHHIKPWRDIYDEVAANPVFNVLPPKPRQRAIDHAFNAKYDKPDDLVPLHVACHREVDFGDTFTDKQRKDVNKRFVHPNMPDHAKPAKKKEKPVEVEEAKTKQESPAELNRSLLNVRRRIERLNEPETTILDRKKRGKLFDDLVREKHEIIDKLERSDRRR